MMKNIAVFFHTLGCRVNQSETATLKQMFASKGYDVVSSPDKADVLIVNTCTVTAKADSDCRRFVGKIVRENPRIWVALAGCWAQIERENLLKLPRVRWIAGTQDKMRLPDLIRNQIPQEESGVLMSFSPFEKDPFTMPFPGMDPNHTRAILKIQDGCDSFCTYCIVPYARGPCRSREFGDIFKEAKWLCARGVKEIVLTGVHVGNYQHNGKNLCDVLEMLMPLQDIQRIRLSSIELFSISQRLIELMKTSGKLCRYFHIPLQSGSDAMLASMGRRSNVSEIKEVILNIHEDIPEACLGADVIVGFPGETDEMFEQTHMFLKEMPLAYFHVFSFSERKQTKSSQLTGKVLPRIISKRSKILRELSAQKRVLYLSRFAGTVQTVLFEEKKKQVWSGLTDTYIRVNVFSGSDLRNRLLPVFLNKIEGQGLSGRIQT
ncbi:MAG: tRNA (N(6)-L-threonylcarbamoyladenosine(37)-C(2))-methylthiotransferase MtaB [Candidatus Aureabacteria bacterium]|nr:tRNA (N(6)-L-threonylcarbamoyladenosine(37)-C(2))-methylthiotransferase MtaB [Candidatus Auribacterota bacterium]